MGAYLVPLFQPLRSLLLMLLLILLLFNSGNEHDERDEDADYKPYISCFED